MSTSEKLAMFHRQNSQYEAAKKSYDDGFRKRCVAEAKHNLYEPTLFLYFAVKNIILLAYAVDNWDFTDLCADQAERTYAKTSEEAIRAKNVHYLNAVQGLRQELDSLNEFRMKNMAGGGLIEQDYLEMRVEDDELDVDVESMNEMLAALGVADTVL